MKLPGRLLTVAITALAVSALPATAQTYPTRPITLVVPFPAGSTTDLVGRILADKLGDALGQRVVIDNRGGAGGVVGTESVARAESDGYTLLIASPSSISVNPALNPKLTYTPKDLAPVTRDRLGERFAALDAAPTLDETVAINRSAHV